MSKIDDYRKTLASLDDWEPYLLRESGLPGPRGNLELAAAVAELGSAGQFARWLTLGPDEAPVNSPQEFLVFCGVRGQGRLLVEGQRDVLVTLRGFAGDPRWRTREAVAMALQRWGDEDMASLLAAMADWSRGAFLEQRAAAAAFANRGCWPIQALPMPPCGSSMQSRHRSSPSMIVGLQTFVCCERRWATVGVSLWLRCLSRARLSWNDGVLLTTATFAGSCGRTSGKIGYRKWTLRGRRNFYRSYRAAPASREDFALGAQCWYTCDNSLPEYPL